MKKVSYSQIAQSVAAALLITLIVAIASDHNQIRANTTELKDHKLLIQDVVANQKEVIRLSNETSINAAATKVDIEWIKAALSKETR